MKRERVLELATKARMYHGTNRGAVPEYEGYIQELERFTELIEAELSKGQNSEKWVIVPEGWKLLKDTTVKDREWSEDAKYGNGLYFNTCIHCGRNFLGHKRRVICRACNFNAPELQPQPMSQDCSSA